MQLDLWVTDVLQQARLSATEADVRITSFCAIVTVESCNTKAA